MPAMSPAKTAVSSLLFSAVLMCALIGWAYAGSMVQTNHQLQETSISLSIFTPLTNGFNNLINWFRNLLGFGPQTGYPPPSGLYYYTTIPATNTYYTLTMGSNLGSQAVSPSSGEYPADSVVHIAITGAVFGCAEWSGTDQAAIPGQASRLT